MSQGSRAQAEGTLTRKELKLFRIYTLWCARDALATRTWAKDARLLFL